MKAGRTKSGAKRLTNGRSMVHKKGSLYGTLVIRIPVVVVEPMTQEYAEHLEDEFLRHSAETILKYTKNGPPSDMNGLTFGEGKFAME